MHPFLTFAFAHFQVAVWTSAHHDYADLVLAHLLDADQRQALRFVWSRDKCIRKYHPESMKLSSIKDLRKVKRLGYPLELVLAVDDTPSKYQRSYGNLVRIAPFEGNVEDDELPALSRYLEHLRHEPDVRKIEKRGWRRRYR